MILQPLTPKLSRYWRMCSTKRSILRELQHAHLENVHLKGKVLDLGGGKRASYNDIIKVDGQVDTININDLYAPTYMHDANKPWPIADNSYDAFISINTLEHLENDVFALREGLRCLKPGGQFHIMIPFMFRMHGSPYDFHRHTALGWQKILTESGIPESNQRIEPQMWDSLATAFSFLELTRLRYFKPIVMMVGVLRCLGIKSERLPPDLSKSWEEWALGYYLSGTKPL